MCNLSKLSKTWTWAIIAALALVLGLGIAAGTLFVHQLNKEESTKIVQKSNRHLIKSATEEIGNQRIEDILNARQLVKSNELDVIYSPWSRWLTRCGKKKCRQVRKRSCMRPEFCGNNVIKERRACTKKRNCKRKNFRIVKKKKMSKKARSLLTTLHSFYKAWTSWTACSSQCKTTRKRECWFPSVCGSLTISESAYCYTRGSKCERWHRQGKLVKTVTENEINDKKLPEITYGRVGKKSKGGAPQCGRSFSEKGSWALKILGGRASKNGKWPWQVALLDELGNPFCGGTHVRPGWVLTAAHCVNKDELYVRFGEYDVDKAEGTELEHIVERVEIYPNYDRETVDNDIALLKIKTNEDLYEESYRSRMPRYQRNDKKKKPATALPTICLPDQDEPLPTDATCTILGWGKVKAGDVMGSDVLKEARIPIVSDQQCRNYFEESGYYFSPNMFCAGKKDGQIDACKGDSGGPILCEKNGRWTIYGITSFGEECGKKDNYGIYAKVPNYIDWINEKIATFE